MAISFFLMIAISLFQFIFPEIMERPITGRDELTLEVPENYSGPISLISNSKCQNSNRVADLIVIDSSGILNINSDDKFFDLLYEKQNFVEYSFFAGKEQLKCIKGKDINPHKPYFNDEEQYFIFDGSAILFQPVEIHYQSFYVGSINQYRQYKEDWNKIKDHRSEMSEKFLDCN